MANDRKLILVTNDDGVQARGLHHLARIAAEFGDVVVVAPDTAQSGQSAAISVANPLRVTQHPDSDCAHVLSVSGTPVDCVKLALHTLLPRRPDFLFSGINHGSNSGTSITYSGTMGAVLEGCMNHIPSVGFSLLSHSADADFTLSEDYVRQIVKKVVATGLPEGIALNVNIPSKVVPLGVRTCRAARGHWGEEFVCVERADGPCYQLTGRFINEEADATDTDEYWLTRNYISIVPVTPDQSALAFIPSFAKAHDCDL